MGHCRAVGLLHGASDTVVREGGDGRALPVATALRPRGGPGASDSRSGGLPASVWSSLWPGQGHRHARLCASGWDWGSGLLVVPVVWGGVTRRPRCCGRRLRPGGRPGRALGFWAVLATCPGQWAREAPPWAVARGPPARGPSGASRQPQGSHSRLFPNPGRGVGGGHRLRPDRPVAFQEAAWPPLPAGLRAEGPLLPPGLWSLEQPPPDPDSKPCPCPAAAPEPPPRSARGLQTSGQLTALPARPLQGSHCFEEGPQSLGSCGTPPPLHVCPSAHPPSHGGLPVPEQPNTHCPRAFALPSPQPSGSLLVCVSLWALLRCRLRVQPFLCAWFPGCPLPPDVTCLRAGTAVLGFLLCPQGMAHNCPCTHRLPE